MNLNPIPFLAQIPSGPNDPAAIREALKPGRGGSQTDVIIILVCAAGLTLVLLVWAYFIRKRPKAARGSLVVERRRKGSNGDDPGAGERKRRRRGESGERWGRNPTLGETGGLPPPRRDEPSAETSQAETLTASSAQIAPEPTPDREHPQPRIVRPG